MTVTVIGLGKIGLPLAVQFAQKGEQVLGVDLSQQVVNSINAGKEPFPGEKNLQSLLAEVVKNGKLVAHNSTFDCVSRSDVVIVVVPLFVDSQTNPDFRSMDAATVEIGKGLKKGTLISYETTLPVGTTRKRFTKKLEEISGMTVGIDFYVVFSPERVLTGRIFDDLKKYPKIIGGVTPECLKRGFKFYTQMLEFDSRPDLNRANGVWKMKSVEAAEFTKLAETTFRDVNIGLANQFAIYADEINLDIYEVIEAANSQPFSHIHQPGISVGGHCIPVYPKFFLENFPEASIVQAARSQNEMMPKYAVDSILSKFDSSKKYTFAILGLSYRSGVKETYNSGAIEIANEIISLGHTVLIYDPLYDKKEIEKFGFKVFSYQNDRVDCIIIHNNNAEFLEIVQIIGDKTKVIYDGRNMLIGADVETYVMGPGNNKFIDKKL